MCVGSICSTERRSSTSSPTSPASPWRNCAGAGWPRPKREEAGSLACFTHSPRAYTAAKYCRLKKEVFYPDATYDDSREISLAELARRGLEYILSVYAPEPGASGDWQPPKPR